MKRLADLAAFISQLSNTLPGGQRLIPVVKILLVIVLGYAVVRGVK